MAKLAPEELRRRQLAALVAWILAGARSQATALAFEDLHWADPTTLDLMGALYLNNIVEQDHRRIKRLVRPGLGFGSFRTARQTLAGFETMAMMRKGQVRKIDGHDIRGQAAFIADLFDRPHERSEPTHNLRASLVNIVATEPLLRSSCRRVRLASAQSNSGIEARRRLADRVGMRGFRVSDPDGGGDGPCPRLCGGGPRAGRDSRTRDRQWPSYGLGADGGRTARHSR